jgi:hypothetical protein
MEKDIKVWLYDIKKRLKRLMVFFLRRDILKHFIRISS